MNLSYRGIQFQSTAASVSRLPLNVTGKYRGTEFEFPPAISTPLDSGIPLQYRGIVYLAGNR
ncbi:MAG: DUF4278 domain-containing protein [Elainellaceae cyanobacterium]